MSKRYNIRWSESDNKELSRLVRNFNAKVKRLESKYAGSDVIIPERVTVKEMRELIDTRRDLQRELKSLQKFTQRGSEEIITIPNTDNNIELTKWQKEEMTKRAGIINRKRTLRRKKLEEQELSHGGKSLGYTRGDIGMGKADEVVLRPTKIFTKKMTKDDIRYKFSHFRRESQSSYWHKRDIAMREGFIDALETNFNTHDIQDVIKAIREMPVDEFKEILLEDPEDFSTAYPPSDEEYAEYLSKLKSIWLPQDKSSTISNKRVGKK